MDTQDKLFDDPLPDPGQVMRAEAGAGQPETAWQAALANPGGRGTMRRRILEHWFAVGYHRGLTDDELSMALDMHLPSVTRRRDELVRLGWLEPYEHQGAPLTRSTRRGSAARVWTLSPRARAQGLPVQEGEEYRPPSTQREEPAMIGIVIELPHIGPDGTTETVQILVRGVDKVRDGDVTVDVRDKNEPLNVWTPIVLTGGTWDWRAT